jgi:hypothetical protein
LIFSWPEKIKSKYVSSIADSFNSLLYWQLCS